MPESKSLATLLDDPGSMHGVLRHAGFETYGIDIDATTIDYLRSVGVQNVFTQSAEELDRPEGPFDTIVGGEVIEHLANPGQFLVRAKRHLAPNGRIVLTTPNPFSLMYILFGTLKFPNTSPNPQHVAWFCPGTMAALAERSGLAVSQVVPIDDYELSMGSLLYRLFGRLMMLARPVIPSRLRGNSILYVLVPKT